ncbi:unnamed protein product [Bursaphelenchus xylophilus]|uniref:(pine wood nematode) hypothetical protein n=1 Tax=Bursaphelenchus xylophilus TaxID=6326 RepID=A0A1I7RQ49_BURXY|nr:unnamed protein product [Bursaphelenchus xylophilus]CAG9097159.1 unnamed protein product [Bursaphelenchus xylophilus]
MASSLTVKVHPVVYMTMVDAYERRSRMKGSDKALGTLLGFYEKNVVQITNCYSIPFRETAESQELDDTFNKQMWNFCRRATPSEQIVGWFITAGEVTEGCHLYHNYYTQLVNDIAVKKELPPIVLLTLDVTFQGPTKGRLPIRAYTRCDGGVPGQSPQAAIFHPLKVEMDAFPGESIALSVVQNGIYTDRREVFLNNEDDLRNLTETTEDLVRWLERILSYVEDVLRKPEPTAEDQAFGRKLMNIVNIAATQLQSDKLDALVKGSIRDYMMVSYLSQLAKTQLAIQEKLLTN